jgi:tetratricopeptide (TPR) repeat protein
MKATLADLDAAEKYFDMAIAKDPAYAPAYAGRAWVWAYRNQYNLVTFEEAGPKARTAAAKGVELDENSAVNQTALACVMTFVEWDWEGAREPWRRALELNPNDANAQALYAHYLLIMGRGEEALVHSQRAAGLDPFNPTVLGFHASVLYGERRYDEAVAAAKAGLRIQEDNPILMGNLMSVYLQKGMIKEAAEYARAFLPVVLNDPKVVAEFDEGFARGGFAEGMKRVAEYQVARAFYRPGDIGNSYAFAGEKDKALEWLEKGVDTRDPALQYLLSDPVYDFVRSDPRFRELLRKVGLPTDDPTPRKR